MAVDVWRKGIPEGKQVDRAKGGLVTPRLLVVNYR